MIIKCNWPSLIKRAFPITTKIMQSQRVDYLTKTSVLYVSCSHGMVIINEINNINQVFISTDFIAAHGYILD